MPDVFDRFGVDPAQGDVFDRALAGASKNQRDAYARTLRDEARRTREDGERRARERQAQIERDAASNRAATGAAVQRQREGALPTRGGLGGALGGTRYGPTGAPQADSWADIGRKTAERFLPNLTVGAAGAFEAIVESAPSTMRSVLGRVTGGLGSAIMDVTGATGAAKTASEGLRASGQLPGQQLRQEALRDLEDSAFDPGDSEVKRYAGMISDSVTQMIPSIAASIATRNPNIGVATMFGQVGGQQYGESRDKGRSIDEATMDAAVIGGAEAISERIPLGMLMKPGGKFLARTLKVAGAESLQEMFTQAVQTGYQAGVLKEEMTWGEAWQGMIDAGIVGASVGGGLSAGLDTARAATDIVRKRPAAPGIRETAEIIAAQPTQDDIDSPLPTELITAGRATLARGEATGGADAILEGAGFPKVGTRVDVTLPGGNTVSGAVTDAFDADGSQGIKIRLGDGSLFEHHFDELADAGVIVTPYPIASSPLAVGTTGGVGPAPRPRPSAPRSIDAVVDAVMPRIGRAESPNDTARNPNSSAQGRYQFIDSTWLATYRAEFGATGESDAAILAKKTDGALQDRLMRRFTKGNAAALERAGVAVDPGTLYLAHFAGAGGAVALAKADPSAAVEAVLGAKAVEANPFLRGKTVGETIAWAARKVGAQPGAMGAGGTATAEPDAIQWDDIDFADSASVVPLTSDTAAPAPRMVDEATASTATTEDDDSWLTDELPEFNSPKPNDEQEWEPSVDASGRQNGWQVVGTTERLEAERTARAAADTDRRRQEAEAAVNARNGWRQATADWFDAASDGDEVTLPGDLTYRVVEGTSQRFGKTKSLYPVNNDGTVANQNVPAMRRLGDRLQGAEAGGFDPDHFGQHPETTMQSTAALIGQDIAAGAATFRKADGEVVTQATGSGAAIEAPQAAPATPIPLRAEGRTDTAVTGAGRSVPVRYAVVEAADLIASNDAEGNANPRYPANLQPRDRTRGVSQAQVVDIAANLNPRLLGESPKASDGAPIISPDGVVESGNGRTLALQRAYAAGGSQADAYRAFLTEQGYDVAGVQQPVLVRVRDGAMAPADVEAFTREANARDTLGYSSTEQAVSDAAALPADVLGMYRGGDIDAAGNREFVRAFIRSTVSKTDQASMIAADGSISQSAIGRIRGALLARAYGNENVVAQATESTDSDIKTITGAMTDVAGAWAQMAAAARDGTIDPAVDITAALNEAVGIVDRARREGRAVADLVGQTDMFGGGIAPRVEGLLRLFFARPDFTRPVSRKRLVEALNFYAAEAMKTAPGGGLFGEATKASPDAIVGLARDKINVQGPEQPDLLTAPAAAERPVAEPAGADASADGAVVERSDRAVVPQDGGEQDRRDVETAPAAEPEPVEPASASSDAPTAEAVPVYDDEIENLQIGWLDPATGKVSRVAGETAARDARQSRTNDSPASSEDAPVAVLTGDEFGRMLPPGRQRIIELRNRAFDWFERKLLGRTVTASDGLPVTFSRVGAKHSTARKGDIVLRAIPAIEALLTKGKRYPMPDKPGGMMRAEIFIGNVEIDGQTYRMGAITRSDAQGRRQYDLTNAVSDIGDPANSAEPRNSGGAASRTTRGGPELDVASDADLNLVLLDADYNAGEPTADDEARWKRLNAAQANFRARLKQLGIADKVTVTAVDAGFLGRNIAGLYEPGGLITVALDSSQSPTFTLNHEAVHALRDLGAFSPTEWSILAAAARADKPLMADVARRYPDLSSDGRIEEAIADRFAKFAEGRGERGIAQRVFERVRDMIRALGQALRGQGFTTADSVMRAVEVGRIGRRGEPGQEASQQGGIERAPGRNRNAPQAGLAGAIARGRERAKKMVVYHGSPHDFDTFSLDAIGTGEGAQAFGWGLYFAGKKQVAEYYRRALAGAPQYSAADIAEYFSPGSIVEGYGGSDKVVSFQPGPTDAPWEWSVTVQRVDASGAPMRGERPRNHATRPDNAKLQAVLGRAPTVVPGRLYHVDIPEDGEYLLWDAPLKEQPAKVRDALRSMGITGGGDGVRAAQIEREIAILNRTIDRGGAFADAAMGAKEELLLEYDEIADPDGQKIYRDLARQMVDTSADIDEMANGGWGVASPARRADPRAASNALREAGVAGIKYLDGGSRGTANDGSFNYVLFDDTRARVEAKYSRTDGPGLPGIIGSPTPSPRRTHQPLLDLEGGNASPPAAGLTDSAGGTPSGNRIAAAVDLWRTRLQDRMLPLLRTQQAAERVLGRRLDERENPYIGEELMTGRVGAQLEQLADTMVEPLFDAMNAEGVTIDELETYLYARHAPERNARIAAINPEFGPGEGSGMTDIEAAAIMARIDKAGKSEAMQRLAGRIDAVLQFSVDTRVEAGLMSAADAQAWRDTYQHYVPLRGQAEMAGDSVLPAPRGSRSSGISVTGKESKRAFGRRSKADNILAYSIMQAEEAIARAGTNAVAKQFLALAQSAPDPDFWKVDKVTRRAVWNKAAGQVEYRAERRLGAADKDFTVTAKVDGVEHRITLNRGNKAAANLAVAMRNLTAQQTEWVVRFLGTPNRFLSAVNTSYNPEFVVTNAFRDLQAAGVNLNQYDVPGLVRGVMKDYPKALAASIRGAFKTDKGEWGQTYREFVMSGGRVYFNNVEDLDGIRKRIERSFTLSSERATGRMSVRRGFLATRDFIENANNGVENAIRLSAFKNARAAGMSRTDAASLAKNLTVNFNRRGSWGAGINAAYLFFNASVQGTAVMLTAIKSPRVQKLLAGAVATGAALEMLNAFLSGDDDDGEAYYDKVSDFDKQRNLIVMIPGSKGDFIKIPLPYGYNAFFGLGRTVAEVARRGGEGWQKSTAGLATTIVDAFNPVGGTESLLNLIAPTIVDPIVDLQRNRDYADRPIMPDQSQFGPIEPDAQRYFGSVAPYWKAITDGLTAISGGDDVQPGAIDVSPETLEHLSGVVFGAAGGFIDRNFSAVVRAFDPVAREELGANDVPLARKVLGSKPSWYDKSAFYDRLGQVEQNVAYAKDYLKLERPEAVEQLVADNPVPFAMEAEAKAARKELRGLRKERAGFKLDHELGKIDDATFEASRLGYADAEAAVVARFNAAWNGAAAGERAAP